MQYRIILLDSNYTTRRVVLNILTSLLNIVILLLYFLFINVLIITTEIYIYLFQVSFKGTRCAF